MNELLRAKKTHKKYKGTFKILFKNPLNNINRKTKDCAFAWAKVQWIQGLWPLCNQLHRILSQVGLE